MTAIQAYESVLIELNKVKAPHLSLNDFVYFFNKAIQQYVNLVYNQYDINQQRVDDLRVLKASTKLSLHQLNSDDFLSDGVWATNLPDDYLHILNCVVAFQKDTKYEHCGNPDKKYVFIGAKRLPSNASSQVITNHYFKPSYRNPYFYINNVDSDSEIQGQDNLQRIDGQAKSYIINKDCEMLEITKNGTVLKKINLTSYPSILSKFRELLKIKNQTSDNIKDPFFQNLKVNLLNDNQIEVSLIGYEINANLGIQDNGSSNYLIDKESLVRYGNSTKVRIEIRCGENNKYIPDHIYVDYIKSPQMVSLNEDLLDDIQDNSQILEFPDNVIYEIINQTVTLILDNISDANRLQMNKVINQTIAPAIGQTKK